eukprot:Hpha_TRINITY_DN15254_c3_g5::TRINITY_DN15254_c3_g5_i1::g.65856::m.65856
MRTLPLLLAVSLRLVGGSVTTTTTGSETATLTYPTSSSSFSETFSFSLTGTRTLTLSVTLPTYTSSVTSSVSLVRTLTLTLPTSSVSASRSFSRSSTVTLPSSSGTYSASITKTVTLPSASISVTRSRTLTLTLPTVTVTTTLTLPSFSTSATLPSGTRTFTLPSLEATSTRTLSVTNTVSITLGSVSVTRSATRTLTPSGTVSASITNSLPTYTTSMTLPTRSRTSTVTRTLTFTLPTLTRSGSATGSVTLPSETLTSTATLPPTATSTPSLPTDSATVTFTLTESSSETLTTTQTVSSVVTVSTTLPTGGTTMTASDTTTTTQTMSLTLPTSSTTSTRTVTVTTTLPSASSTTTRTLTVTLPSSALTASRTVTKTLTLPSSTKSLTLPSMPKTTTLTLPSASDTETLTLPSGTDVATVSLTLTLPSHTITASGSLTLPTETVSDTADLPSATESPTLPSGSPSGTISITLPVKTDSLTLPTQTGSESATESMKTASGTPSLPTATQTAHTLTDEETDTPTPSTLSLEITWTPPDTSTGTYSETESASFSATDSDTESGSTELSATLPTRSLTQTLPTVSQQITGTQSGTDSVTLPERTESLSDTASLTSTESLPTVTESPEPTETMPTLTDSRSESESQTYSESVSLPTETDSPTVILPTATQTQSESQTVTEAGNTVTLPIVPPGTPLLVLQGQAPGSALPFSLNPSDLRSPGGAELVLDSPVALFTPVEMNASQDFSVAHVASRRGNTLQVQVVVMTSDLDPLYAPRSVSALGRITARATVRSLSISLVAPGLRVMVDEHLVVRLMPSLFVNEAHATAACGVNWTGCEFAVHLSAEPSELPYQSEIATIEVAAVSTAGALAVIAGIADRPIGASGLLGLSRAALVETMFRCGGDVDLGSIKAAVSPVATAAGWEGCSGAVWGNSLLVAVLGLPVLAVCAFRLAVQQCASVAPDEILTPEQIRRERQANSAGGLLVSANAGAMLPVLMLMAPGLALGSATCAQRGSGVAAVGAVIIAVLLVWTTTATASADFISKVKQRRRWHSKPAHSTGSCSAGCSFSLEPPPDPLEKPPEGCFPPPVPLLRALHSKLLLGRMVWQHRTRPPPLHSRTWNGCCTRVCGWWYGASAAAQRNSASRRAAELEYPFRALTALRLHRAAIWQHRPRRHWTVAAEVIHVCALAGCSAVTPYDRGGCATRGWAYAGLLCVPPALHGLLRPHLSPMETGVALLASLLETASAFAGAHALDSLSMDPESSASAEASFVLLAMSLCVSMLRLLVCAAPLATELLDRWVRISGVRARQGRVDDKSESEEEDEEDEEGEVEVGRYAIPASPLAPAEGGGGEEAAAEDEGQGGGAKEPKAKTGSRAVIDVGKGPVDVGQGWVNKPPEGLALHLARTSAKTHAATMAHGPDLVPPPSPSRFGDSVAQAQQRRPPEAVSLPETPGDAVLAPEGK